MKITNEGYAVIEGDTYLSNDIITQKRLDVAREFLLPFRKYIPEGGVVCDVGACLGDYTATFSEFVGPQGRVYAFEPNPPVSLCLRYNMRDYRNVDLYDVALGSQDCWTASMAIDTNNIGASRLVFDDGGSTPVVAMDRMAMTWKRLDFLKIDAEGCEPLVLDGAVGTILRLRPVILIEVNTWPLGKLGFTSEDVFSRLDNLKYSFERFDGPYGDVLCLPKEIA